MTCSFKSSGYSDTCTPTYIKPFFAIARNGNNHVSANIWVDKQNVAYTYRVHTAEYYSVVKRNEIPIHVTIWMNSGNITLSEYARCKRTSIFWCTDRRTLGFSERESRLEISRDWRKYRISVQHGERVSSGNSMGTVLWMFNAAELETQKWWCYMHFATIFENSCSCSFEILISRVVKKTNNIQHIDWKALFKCHFTLIF